jgi:nitroreductase
MSKVLEKAQGRVAEHPIDPIFTNRWSPRAMSGEEVSGDELMPLFEAAKWAPSSYNNQSWRFLYATRSSPEWGQFLDLLDEWNRSWAKNAGALVLIISKNTLDFNSQPARTHSFDAGAAWENFALQGSMNGLAVHGMEGFDYERAKRALGIPEGYTVEAMVAVGRPGRKEDLLPALREREFPSDRKKLAEIIFRGRFGQV